MLENKRPLKVFLCHASQDKPVVRELSRRLVAEGWIDAWLDEKKLLPGQDWRLSIEDAVETSDIVIICLSSNSVSKEGFVQKELRYAREIALEKPEETIFLIPLRLDDCTVPRGLRFYQWADYFGEKKEETYTILIESLKLRHGQKLKIEDEERARNEKEILNRESLEKAVRENEKREADEKVAIERAAREVSEKAAREKAALEKAKREADEKFARERSEREAVDKAAREKAKRDAIEKTKREKTERHSAQNDAITNTFTRSFTWLKSILPKVVPLLGIIGIVGIILALMWIASWAVPNIYSLMPKPKAIATRQPFATITSKDSTLPFIVTIKPTATIVVSLTAKFETKIPTTAQTLGGNPVPTDSEPVTALPTYISGVNRILYGEKATSYLHNGKPIVYGFSGHIYDKITLILQFDPGYSGTIASLELIDQYGNKLIMSKAQNLTSIKSYTLPYSGVYYVYVTCIGSQCSGSIPLAELSLQKE